MNRYVILLSILTIMAQALKVMDNRQTAGTCTRYWRDMDSDTVCLVRAAQIVRKAIFQQKYEFDRTFKKGCEASECHYI